LLALPKFGEIYHNRLRAGVPVRPGGIFS